MKYLSLKLGTCPKCHYVVGQSLFDYKYLIYKCTKCNNIHV